MAEKLSRKAARRKEQVRALLLAVGVLAITAIVVGGTMLYMQWKDAQIQTLPQDQRIIAVVDGKEISLAPYSTCELDDPDCQTGTPTVLQVGDAESFTLRIPEDVYNHDWSLLKVYDDPGANREQYFTSYEADEVEVVVGADVVSADGSEPKLVVVEIQSLLVGLDSNEDQTPIATIWSLEIQQ